MKIASITLSALIDSLKAGSSVLIVDRERPVARLEPVIGTPEEPADGKLSRLLREGAVRPRRSNPPLALFAHTPPRVRPGASGVDTLISERRERR
jgi:antitoxin (DNA-binding transcriptional repressor) of toxin-antitoxin stability system